MARQSMMNDTAAQVCFRYIHGEFGSDKNEKIWRTVREIVPSNMIVHFVFEIAYRIGYARSYIAGDFSEATYKKKKKQIRDNIQKMFSGEGLIYGK